MSSGMDHHSATILMIVREAGVSISYKEAAKLIDEAEKLKEAGDNVLGDN